MLFDYKTRKTMSKTEKDIFDFVLYNLRSVMDMNVRELAAATYVSTATIVRFTRKLGCDGFSDFKTQLKEYYDGEVIPSSRDEIDDITGFFKYAATEEFERKIVGMADRLEKYDILCFFGMGNSAGIAAYAARYFSNIGIYSFSVTDPFYPPYVKMNKINGAIFFLSRSGETKEIIDQAYACKKRLMPVFSVTNNADTRLSLMSDYTIDCRVRDVALPHAYDLTSQVPVIYVIERLARELQNRMAGMLPVWSGVTPNQHRSEDE